MIQSNTVMYSSLGPCKLDTKLLQGRCSISNPASEPTCTCTDNSTLLRSPHVRCTRQLTLSNTSTPSLLQASQAATDGEASSCLFPPSACTRGGLCGVSRCDGRLDSRSWLHRLGRRGVPGRAASRSSPAQAPWYIAHSTHYIAFAPDPSHDWRWCIGWRTRGGPTPAFAPKAKAASARAALVRLSRATGRTTSQL